ncbi:VOC family protein [Algihabitans sp.]|uniref:VOC family protein n=1 Tax=Algihabitans sp. TaxID=2821514 RepID=UPI003BA91CDC
MALVESLDHLVLTVEDIERTCDFYETALGLERETFGEGRTALRFGQQKINLHPNPSPIDTKAGNPTPGSADICFIAAVPLEQVRETLEAAGIPLVAGPVPRVGALGPVTSLYIRDPDDNLVEVATYD